MYTLCLCDSSLSFQPLPSPTTKLIQAGLTKTFAITQTSSGDLFHHSAQFLTFQTLSIPEPVLEISTNLSMALFLTPSSIWLLGEDRKKSGLFASETCFFSEIPIKLPTNTKKLLISASISSHHAGFVTEDGEIYTWGEGHDWELGCKDVKRSQVQLLQSGDFFKAKQIVCGEKFTAVVTQGGFLYVYGKKVLCSCGGTSGYPYAIKALERYFIDKVYSSVFGIVGLSDQRRGFLAKGCLCVEELGMERLLQVVPCEKGIFGVSNDRMRVYLWTRDDEKWKKTVFVTNELVSIFPGWGDWVLMFGKEGFEVVEDWKGDENSWEGSPENGERTSFEQIFRNYDFSGVSNEKSVANEEGCKVLARILSKFVAESFRKVKEFSYFQWISKKTFGEEFVIAQRLNDKKRKNGDVENNCRGKLKNPKLMINFALMLCKSELKKVEIFVLKFKKVYLKKKKNEQDRNPFELSLRIIEHHNAKNKKSSLVLWKRFVKSSQLTFSNPITPSAAHKFGLYLLSSTISKLNSKQKSQTFNILLLQRPKQSKIDSFLHFLNLLLTSHLSSVFTSIKLNSLTAKNTLMIRFILFLQSLQKKIIYRTVIKGFNAFRNNFISKISASDVSSEFSGHFKRLSGFIGHPNNFAVLESAARRASLSILESTTTSSGHRASLSSLQKQLVKKITEKISNESKSQNFNRPKAPDRPKNNTIKKRNSYYSLMKGLQKKKIISELPSECASRKNSILTTSFEMQSGPERPEQKNWSENNCLAIVKVLKKFEDANKKSCFNAFRSLFVNQKKKVFIGTERSRRSPELKIDVKITREEFLRIPREMCDSPVASPIGRRSDEGFIMPPSPFIDLNTPMSSESKFGSDFWKTRLLVLGVNKFSRTIKIIVYRKLFGETSRIKS